MQLNWVVSKGQGMGEGISKESVKEAHTDYIIANQFHEEFGSIISSMIIINFFYISHLELLKIVLIKRYFIKIPRYGLSY